jgi:hypothetical protein
MASGAEYNVANHPSNPSANSLIPNESSSTTIDSASLSLGDQGGGATTGSTLRTVEATDSVVKHATRVPIVYDLGGTESEGYHDWSTGTLRITNPAGVEVASASFVRFISGSGGSDTDYIDYIVTTAHNGLAVNQRVRERISETGVTWTDLDGNALAGTPDRTNLERIGGSTPTIYTTDTGPTDAQSLRTVTADDSPDVVVLGELRDRVPDPSTLQSFGATGSAVSGVVKNAAGRLYSIQATNLNAADRYLMLFNRTTAPAASDPPHQGHSYPVYGGGGHYVLGAELLGGSGLAFANGIAWGVSTDPLQYVAATANEVIIQGRFS